jgi:hypothetical protein
VDVVQQHDQTIGHRSELAGESFDEGRSQRGAADRDGVAEPRVEAELHCHQRAQELAGEHHGIVMGRRQRQ